MADDHTIVRQGLRQLLSLDPQIEVVAEAASGTDALEYLRQRPADVVVLDITMPGRNGLDTLKDIKRLHPRIAVIVLSMHPMDQYAVRVIKAGAAGYIPKEAAPNELLTAIRGAARGEKYITPDVAALLADYVEHRVGGKPHESLSDREFDVMRMIALGKSIGEIAEELRLSAKTISTYKSRVMEKTGLGSNAEIVRYSIEHALI